MTHSSQQSTTPSQEAGNNSPRDLTALVTGARGFVGKELCNQLLRAGFRVIDFDLPGTPRPKAWEGDQRITAFDGDITRAGDIQKAIDGADKVFHLAAIVSDCIPWHLHNQITIEGSRSLFEASKKRGAHVILVSSIVVYGDKLQHGVCDESSSFGKPQGLYSKAKQLQETLAREYEANGMLLSIVRPANVYGVGSGPWVNTLCDLIKGGKPVLLGSGEQCANLVHVANLAALMIRVACSDAGKGEVFNGIDETTQSWQSYTGLLAEALGQKPPETLNQTLGYVVAVVGERVWGWCKLSGRPPLTREAFNLLTAKASIPNTKARKLLGFKPEVDEQGGLEEIRSHVASIG